MVPLEPSQSCHIVSLELQAVAGGMYCSENMIWFDLIFIRWIEQNVQLYMECDMKTLRLQTKSTYIEDCIWSLYGTYTCIYYLKNWKYEKIDMHTSGWINLGLAHESLRLVSEGVLLGNNC